MPHSRIKGGKSTILVGVLPFMCQPAHTVSEHIVPPFSTSKAETASNQAYRCTADTISY